MVSDAPRRTPGRRRRNVLEPQAERTAAFIERAFGRGLSMTFVRTEIELATRTEAERAGTDDAFASFVTGDLVAAPLLSAVSVSVRRFVKEHLEALEADDAATVSESGVRDAREIMEVLTKCAETAYGNLERVPGALLDRIPEFAVRLRIAAVQALLACGGAPNTAEKVGVLRVGILSGDMRRRIEDAVENAR